MTSPDQREPVSLDKAQPLPPPIAYPEPVQYPPPVYSAPAPVYNYYAMPPAPPPTNTLALTALIMTLAGWLFLGPFVALVTIPMAHIALSQIKRTGEQGRGFAVASLVIGYIVVALSVLALVLLVVVFGIFVGAT